MKILRYYNSVFEAEVVRGRLESEGIQAFVQNSNLSNVLPYLNAAQTNPYVEVADDDFTRAVAILELKPEIEKPTECPGCGSKEFKFAFHRKDKELNRIAGFAAVMVVAVTAGTPGKIRRDYHCRQCGTWF